MGPRLPGVRAAWERSIGPAAVPEALDGAGRGAGVWVGAFWWAGQELWDRKSLALLSNLMQSWTNSSKVSGDDAWYERAVFNPWLAPFGKKEVLVISL